MGRLTTRNLAMLVFLMLAPVILGAESGNPFPYVKRKCFKGCYYRCLMASGGPTPSDADCWDRCWFGCPPAGPYNANFKECYYGCMNKSGGKNVKCGYECWYGFFPPGAYDFAFNECKENCNARVGAGSGSNKTCGMNCWWNHEAEAEAEMINERAEDEEIPGEKVEYLMKLA